MSRPGLKTAVPMIATDPIQCATKHTGDIVIVLITGKVRSFVKITEFADFVMLTPSLTNLHCPATCKDVGR